MIITKENKHRILFTLTTFILCLFISYRNIPSFFDPNDTGRYIDFLHAYCGDEFNALAEIKKSEYYILNLFSTPACLINSDRLFLFEIAFLIPTAFVFLINWKKNTIVLAASGFLNMSSFEFMMNAFRQELGFFFFLYAIATVQKKPYIGISMGILAMYTHSSFGYYLPLLFFILQFNFLKKMQFNFLKKIHIYIFLITTLLFFSLLSEIINFFNLNDDFFLFSEGYSEKSNNFFVLYMISPLYWIYGARHFIDKEYITYNEKLTIIYSTILIVACLFYFPLIMYRFVFISIVLQIFLIALSEKYTTKSIKYIFMGNFAHLIILVFISDGYREFYINSFIGKIS